MGGPQFFFRRTRGALKGQKGGLGGSSLIKVRDFHLPYFDIMFEGVLNFVKRLKGVPEKQ